MIMKVSISKGAISLIAETEAELIDIRQMSEKTFKSSYVTPSSSRYVGGKGMVFFIPIDTTVKPICPKCSNPMELVDDNWICFTRHQDCGISQDPNWYHSPGGYHLVED